MKGSCRSDGSVNVVEMFSHSGKVLVEYGGHPFSGGFSVTRENIHKLEKVFIESYEKVKISDSTAEQVVIDKKLWLDEVGWDTYRLIERLAPFGTGNSKPIFLFEDVEIAQVKHFGKAKEHLQLDIVNGSDRTIPAISFFTTEKSFEKPLKEGEKINLVAHIERSVFGRIPELRLRIVSIT